MPVRSATLAHGTVSAAGYHGLFVVPAGWTFLVKDVRIANLGGAPTALRFWAALAGRSTLVGVFEAEAGKVTGQAPWLALTAGTDLSAQLLTAVATSLWISGSQLPGAQQFPSAAPALRLG